MEKKLQKYELEPTKSAQRATILKHFYQKRRRKPISFLTHIQAVTDAPARRRELSFVVKIYVIERSFEKVIHNLRLRPRPSHTEK